MSADLSLIAALRCRLADARQRTAELEDELRAACKRIADLTSERDALAERESDLSHAARGHARVLADRDAWIRAPNVRIADLEAEREQRDPDPEPVDRAEVCAGTRYGSRCTLLGGHEGLHDADGWTWSDRDSDPVQRREPDDKPDVFDALADRLGIPELRREVASLARIVGDGRRA